ncbi:MAG TPA: DUF3300 domain-containing protein [Dongiaceae bacterium]
MVTPANKLIGALFALGFLVSIQAGAQAQFADAAAETTTAADDGTGQSTLLTAEELNALVAPVALYPDDLLAIVLPASTNPVQVVEAQRFLDKRASDPNLKPDENWDPSILALVNYPEVVKKMNDDLSWTQDLGNAVLDQQDDVLKAIQVARQSASDGGYLQSNDKQVVVNEGDNITIESSDPEVIYVPTYDPAPVVYNNYTNYPPPYYSDPYPPYWAPAATFFAGAFVGAAFAYGFDWDNGDIDIDNDVNISRGDTNIGSGNTNIDRSKLENKFNGDRKAGANNKMKWSPEKARQKSGTTRRTPTANRPSSSNIQKQLGQGGSGQFKGGGQNQLQNNKATRNQSNRGNSSLSQTGKPKQQMRQNAGTRQQMQRQNTQRQNTQRAQPSQRQLKQKPGGGGSFGNMQSGSRTKAQSSRGNRSMGGGGGGGRPPRTGGRR